MKSLIFNLKEENLNIFIRTLDLICGKRVSSVNTFKDSNYND